MDTVLLSFKAGDEEQLVEPAPAHIFHTPYTYEMLMERAAAGVLKRVMDIATIEVGGAFTVKIQGRYDEVLVWGNGKPVRVVLEREPLFAWAHCKCREKSTKTLAN